MMANLYNKPGVLPFLSLCSRYPGFPGLLQQTIKEKQNISFGIQRFVNDDQDTTSASEAEENETKNSAFSPWNNNNNSEQGIISFFPKFFFRLLVYSRVPNKRPSSNKRQGRIFFLKSQSY